jgi:hypothetical protein
LAVHVQATDQLRAVIASAMTSPQLELGEIADTRSAPRSSAGTAKALDDLEIFIGEVDGSEAAEGGTIDGTEAIEALNALRAAFAGRQPSVGNDDVDQASARALVLENSKLREDVEKWHRVAMEAGAITCVGGTHIYPLRDEVKKLRAEVARLTAEPQSLWQPIETAPRDNPDGYPDETPATAKPNAAGLTPTKAAHALKQAGPYVAAPALQSAPAPAVGAWRAMVLAWLAGAGSGALVTLLVLCQLRSP